MSVRLHHKIGDAAPHLRYIWMCEKMSQKSLKTLLTTAPVKCYIIKHARGARHERNELPKKVEKSS